jgi:polyhydroxyalkanoate synthesis repressor PhaR
VERTHTAQVRLIKRYGNRKLYDVRSSRYVTLDGVRSLVQAGEDVRVIDNDSGEDLTGITFAQIIYEETKRQNGVYSLPFLRWIIQRGDEAVRDVLRSVERGREALGNVRDAAEKRVQKLVGGSGKGKRTLIEDLIELPQKRLDDLQHRIDSQVRQSVQRVTKHPAFRTEIKRVERSIRDLEDRIGRIGKRRAPAAKTRRKAKK